uniref:DUF5683 domain-containing protein n=1 Tax=Prevotellamassilia timonensis TaxID=1852370 RepID=UPI00402827ED
MSSHTLRSVVLMVMLACSQALALYARNTAKVGASNGVPALAVFAAARTGCPAMRPDTVKTPDELAREHSTDADADFDRMAAELASDSDSMVMPVDTARLQHTADSLKAHPATLPANGKGGKPKVFVPNPTKALWLSLVCPGAGQIYNRKYWKLPFIYGGFLGCAYALMWNQMMYRDYSQAYLDIMDDNPNTNSYLDMLPPRYDITGREDQFKNIFKRKKNFYRRYRDLSAFCFVGVYLLSVVDAYVDAQLSVFDISPDLSMRVEPAVIGQPALLGSSSGRSAYGVGCSLTF